MSSDNLHSLHPSAGSPMAILVPGSGSLAGTKASVTHRCLAEHHRKSLKITESFDVRSRQER